MKGGAYEIDLLPTMEEISLLARDGEFLMIVVSFSSAILIVAIALSIMYLVCWINGRLKSGRRAS